MLAYIIFLGPAMLFAIWAQFRVKSAIAKGNQIPVSSRMSGREAAFKILQSYGLEQQVGIEQTNGMMGDHYDPRAKVLRLSHDVYSGRSVTAVGVAAHEVGHALQDAEKYGPLVIRNAVVPVASIGSNMSWVLLFVGALIGSMGLVVLGVALFSLVVFFQIINLPVEFNASSRAKEILLARGFISPAEEREVSKVLDAAAMTYVAATITAVLTLLYYLYRLGLIGGRR